MVEETGNNNPIVNATKALASHVDKVGEKIFLYAIVQRFI